jgi:hypothetical protein
MFPNFLTSWQSRHGTHFSTITTKDKYQSRENNVMLDDIIREHPYTLIAGSIAAATIAIPLVLSALEIWTQRDSPIIENEAHAHAYFEKVLNHYGIEDELELRLTHKGFNYISRGEDRYIVFINMKKNPKEASIQHEVLHYVNGDTRYDPEKRNFFGKIASWVAYFLYLEPRIIMKTMRNKI